MRTISNKVGVTSKRGRPELVHERPQRKFICSECGWAGAFGTPETIDHMVTQHGYAVLPGGRGMYKPRKCGCGKPGLYTFGSTTQVLCRGCMERVRLHITHKSIASKEKKWADRQEVDCAD
jgi:hypothetical protein